MIAEIRGPTDAELLAASDIHFECLPGNNDERDGSGWIPMHPTDGGPRQVVLVAVADAVVVGYVFGDENTSGVAVCQEIAVTAAQRRRGLTRALLGAFARYAIGEWSADLVYLRSLDTPWLVAFYERVGFEEDPDGSGYLRIEARNLAELS